jgi:putative SOS response-associated peptidase YedK
MCGRFDIHSAIEIIARFFDVDDVACDFAANYNVAPSQNIPIVVNTGKKNRLILSRWGFLPSWAKETRTAYSMINARAETVDSNRSYKDAFLMSRCLVVADGFYEWQRRNKVKIPYYIHLRSAAPMAFAGLYNMWTSPEGGEISTAAIVTTGANELMAQIHDRMPVILHRDDFSLWLNPEVHDKGILKPLLKPFPPEEMEAYQVSPKVNSPKFNSPDNIMPTT